MSSVHLEEGTFFFLTYPKVASGLVAALLTAA
jgi:hypothetical protein